MEIYETVDSIKELLPYITEEERRFIYYQLEQDAQRCMWRPLPGPQYMAYTSQADVIGYGGAAGAGKTDLLIGKAITQHTMSLIMRREYTQMKGIIQRMTEIMGGREGYNGQDKLWRIPAGNRLVEFGSVPNLGDEVNFQGRPRDLLGIDEAANFIRQQVTFLMGWVRTTIQDQKTQTLMTFNPPTNAEGQWVIDYFAPWIDDNHLIPALPGELRWFAMIDGEEVEVPDGSVFKHGTENIIPTSRTFIPGNVENNPFLMGTNYVAALQAMPEPLRSQMLYGSFQAGMEDDPWQVIPTRWVKIAMNRWKERDRKPVMDSVGVDVARGGRDSSIIARRHEFWFDKLIEVQGVDTDSGPKLAGQVVANIRDNAPIHIDVIGVGASPYDFLVQARQQVIGVNGAEACGERDKSGRLSFKNMRSYMHWNLRELLDPDANNGIALPPDPQLEKELCALTWRVQGSTIYVESREEIIKRIGRSNDRGTAVALAALDTPKHNPATMVDQARVRRSYDPMAQYTEHAASRRAYNPLARR